MTTETQALSVIEKSALAVVRVDPAQLLAVIDENLAGALSSPFQLDRVRVPAGGGTVWTVPSLEEDDGEPAKEITGVLIHKREGLKSWWALTYEESLGQKSPPSCHSEDGVYGSWPEVGAPLRNGRPLCAQCPKGAWGSSRKGGKGKDCKDLAMLFLVPDTGILPILFVAPPTSLGPLTKYFLRLSSQAKAFWQVRTSLGLEKVTGAIPYSIVKPRKVGDLEPVERERIAQYRAAMIPFLDAVQPDQSDVGNGG